MFIQMISLLIISTIAGILIFIIKFTDPNTTPSPSREQLYPFGHALLYAGVYGIGAIFGLSYIGEFLPFDSWPRLFGLLMFGGYGLSILAVAWFGYKVGRRKYGENNDGE
jgi:hypothetical protein